MHPKIVFTRDEEATLLALAAREGCTPGDVLRRILMREFYSRGSHPQEDAKRTPEGNHCAESGEGVPDAN